ncbi:unnamed protein product [Zymoseptoria tritici ST99CH_1A5]|uniref:Mannosyltransferase n=1 Tax=Zymoseptoria tritici ST99CH_1A5 TaxID=1276529 RepID=A0A1Y6M0J6_ZYMTR|nr:unnamed protein product [Zymoseptoria tritici ST99CH_1A5]
MPLKHDETSSHRRQAEASANIAPGLALALLFTLRLANSYFVQTSFQPDEYFQSLEPAWDLAFGPESGAWLTWEWSERLRTSVHPFLFAVVFKSTDLLCNLLGANVHWRANALLAAPKVLQAVFAAVLDYHTWRLADLLHGRRTSYAALILTLISPWQWFCSTRTFSNSLEATVTVVSLYLFPWRWFLAAEATDKQPGVRSGPAGLYSALTGAAVAFYFRPTNILIWIAISAGLVWCTRSFAKSLALVQAAAIVGTTIVAVFASADRLYYGEWACPPLRFLYINLVQSLAVFYGRNRVDYYFTEGLPLLLTTALPFAAYGTWHSLQHRNRDAMSTQAWQSNVKFIFAFAVIFTVLTLSTIAHKEMRFLYPLLPMLHILAARPIASFSLALTRRKSRAAILLVLLAANIVIAYYTTMVHQRGVIDVMHYLRQKQEAAMDGSSDARNITVGFLMPCHSTPWRSHFVYPEIKAWALTCEPPLNLSPEQQATYFDEADVFYDDPAHWLQQNMRDLRTASSDVGGAVSKDLENSMSRRQWPDYLIVFEHLEPILLPFLKDSKYVEDKRLFNTHWHDDSRRKGDVVLTSHHYTSIIFCSFKMPDATSENATSENATSENATSKTFFAVISIVVCAIASLTVILLVNYFERRRKLKIHNAKEAKAKAKADQESQAPCHEVQVFEELPALPDPVHVHG